MGLIEDLESRNETIGIPTPVLAEIGIKTDKSTNEIISILEASDRFQFLSFDSRAALQCALMAREGYLSGNKRHDSKPDESWNKIKFDRQIIAIALVSGATQIYTSDKDVVNKCTRYGLEAVTIFDLKVPDDSRQLNLLQEPPEES